MATELAATATSPETRLAEALELLAEAHGVRPPAPDDAVAVTVFLAEALVAVALNRKALSATGQPRRN